MCCDNYSIWCLCRSICMLCYRILFGAYVVRCLHYGNIFYLVSTTCNMYVIITYSIWCRCCGVGILWLMHMLPTLLYVGISAYNNVIILTIFVMRTKNRHIKSVTFQRITYFITHRKLHTYNSETLSNTLIVTKHIYNMYNNFAITT